MDHVVEGPAGARTRAESFPDLGRVTVTAELQPGQQLRLVKFVACGWSGNRRCPRSAIGPMRRLTRPSQLRVLRSVLNTGMPFSLLQQGRVQTWQLNLGVLL